MTKQLKARFEQKFFLERIADLHSRTNFARSKRCSGQTIASCLCAHVKDRITDAASCSARQLLMTQYTETKDIYEGIPLETLIKIDFTANCRDPNAITVMRDPGNDPGE